MDQLKLVGMTILLTGLIWVAADRLVTEEVAVPAAVRLQSSAGGAEVLFSPSGEIGDFQLRVAGPRKAVNLLLARAPLILRLQVPDLPVGPVTLPLKDMIVEQWREYPGVTVMGLQPAGITVLADRMVTQDVPVMVQPLTLAYDVKPQVQPSMVQLRLRQSVLTELAGGGQLLPIDLSAEAEKLLRDQPAGQPATVPVPVSLDTKAFGTDATVKPKSVEVRATVTAQRTTSEVPTVPILLSVSFANFGKPYKAVSRDGSELVTQTIKVTGPTEDVARLLRGETRVFGIIQLKDEHFAELDIFKPLIPEYQLPTGIELADKPKPVELKLVDPARLPPGEPDRTAP